MKKFIQFILILVLLISAYNAHFNDYKSYIQHFDVEQTGTSTTTNAEPITLSNNLLTLKFDGTNYALIDLFDHKKNYHWISGPSVLFNVAIITKEGITFWVNSNYVCNSRNYEYSKNPDGSQTLILKYNGISIGYEKQAIDIIVTVTMQRDDPTASFRIRIINRSQLLSIWQVQFLSLNTLVKSENPKEDAIIFPFGYGQYVKNYAEAFSKQEHVYPSWGAQYSFIALIHSNNRGLYYGVHDPNGFTKTFSIQSPSYLSVFHHPFNMTKAQPIYETPYDIVLTVFEGDWWDAAQIYRKFVLNKASWTKKGNVQFRKDIPEWYKNTTFWLNSSVYGAFDCFVMNPSQVVKEMMEMRKIFDGVPMGLHWYCYAPHPFDNNYPMYLPPKQGFQVAVQEIQKMGIKVVPYINARLFDFNADIWDENAEMAATKYKAPRIGTKTSQFYIETYGSLQSQAIMCPYTQFWQNKISDIVAEFTHKYGVDGVYLDQIGAAQAYLCFDERHSHPLGGGNYWLTGYRKMLELIENKKRKDTLIMTEYNQEIFLDGIHSFLALHAFGIANPVPVFPAVYGGYFIPVGRYFEPADFQNANNFAFKIGQMFVYGSQVGWIHMSLYHYMKDKNFSKFVDYVKIISKYRLLGLKYLQYGRMMRPLDIASPTIQLMKGPVRGNESPILQHAVWQTNDQNEIGIVITNPSQQNIPLEFLFNVEKYEFKSNERLNVQQITINGNIDLGDFIGEVIPFKNYKVKPLSVIMFSIIRK